MIGNNNILKIILSADNHILNINRKLKNLKSDIIADFVWADHYSFIITTNKVVLSSDLSTIKSYIKNVDSLELNDILTPHLSQSKSYLKIIGISYLVENTNIPINFSYMENMIKNTHFFNNVILVSYYLVLLYAKFTCLENTSP